MKRYKDSRYFDGNFKKKQIRERRNENNAGGFRCSHCKQFVVINSVMGTTNRNHCNWCLWSKHVDESKGDRRATCHAGMQPIGLTFKHEGYGKIGEIMLIHHCSGCPKISINRIARDDPENTILEIFEHSLGLETALRTRLSTMQIYLLSQVDTLELRIQLFGK